MGKRGPSKQPAELKILHGTFRPDRDTLGPQTDAGVAECPAWLPDEAKEKWSTLAPMLEKLGLLRNVDADELARYCLYVVRAIDAEGEVERDGVTVAGAVPGTKVKNPAVQIARDYNAMASRIADKFGMSPSARNGLSFGEKDDGDEMQQYMKKEYEKRR